MQRRRIRRVVVVGVNRWTGARRAYTRGRRRLLAGSERLAAAAAAAATRNRWYARAVDEWNAKQHAALVRSEHHAAGPPHWWADAAAVGEERTAARAPAPPSATPLWGTPLHVRRANASPAANNGRPPLSGYFHFGAFRRLFSAVVFARQRYYDCTHLSHHHIIIVIAHVRV